MSDETTKKERGTFDPTWIAFAIVAACGLFLLFGRVGSVGIWEPWEAHDIFVAQEYVERDAPPVLSDHTPPHSTYNWAVPTHQKRTVERSLLKTWLLAGSLPTSTDAKTIVGSIERRARLPFAAATFALLLAAFFWVRREAGVAPATLGALAFASIPATYLGAHNIGAEMLYPVTTGLACMALWGLRGAESRRWLWGLAAGIALALAALDQRLWGVLLPLATFVTAGVVETIAKGFESEERDWLGIGALVAAALCVASLVGWGYTSSADAKAAFLPHTVQWIAILAPLIILDAGIVFARKSSIVGPAIGPAGAIAVALPLLTLVVVGDAFAAANPTLLKDGIVVGEIPVFTFLLGSHLFEKSLATGHVGFDIWIRQVGFSMVPWVALVPAALAYLADTSRAARPDLRAFLLTWTVVAALITAAASAFGHYIYPAYLPFAVAIGLMLTDHDYWKQARMQPLLMGALGVTAVAVAMMFGKDLQRFPQRFIELYVTLQESFEFPDGFRLGPGVRSLKYVWALTLGVYFFGAVSGGLYLLTRLRELPGWIRDRRVAKRAGSVVRRDFSRAMYERAEWKEAFRRGDGKLARLANALETPRIWAAVITAAFVGTASLSLFVFLPNVGEHVSQRGVFETYTRLAKDDEELVGYQVRSRNASVYLKNITLLRGLNEFVRKFSEDQRFFAVVPRDKLAQLNYEVRKKHKKNVPVVNARSSRLILVSNKLGEGETDENFIAEHIVGEDAPIDYRLDFADGDKQVPATFDGKLELVGYSLGGVDKSDDGPPSAKWGQKVTLTTYYKVLQKVPSAQKMFVHVDYPGSRIHGDHYPNDGDFPTNYWLPGDIVTDVYELEIDSYSTPGEYTINLGFFVGNNRMKVLPRSAHDGHNRVRLGRIKVRSL